MQQIEIKKASSNGLTCVSLSPSSTLKFKDLVPVFYQEGRHQGDPVTLGVGGFGRVQLVSCVVFFSTKLYYLKS